jgi:hypothetical protein
MVALLGAALVAAGCGSDEEKPKPSIPAASVQELEVRLDEVQRRFDSGTDENNPGACADLEEDTFPAIQDLLDGLPSSVDPEVKDTLEEGLARLRELTQEGCAGVEPTETETTEETTPLETETTPPETVTTPPETETTPPPTTPQPTTPQQPPGSGGGGTEVPEEGE